MDSLFGCVAPIAASKTKVKVDWSSSHFSQKIHYLDQTWVFVQMLKTEGDRSGGYSGKLDESIVHG